jgi:hypothetical protein
MLCNNNGIKGRDNCRLNVFCLMCVNAEVFEEFNCGNIYFV